MHENHTWHKNFCLFIVYFTGSKFSTKVFLYYYALLPLKRLIAKIETPTNNRAKPKNKYRNEKTEEWKDDNFSFGTRGVTDIPTAEFMATDFVPYELQYRDEIKNEKKLR